jgi:hypothetical protein
MRFGDKEIHSARKSLDQGSSQKLEKGPKIMT